MIILCVGASALAGLRVTPATSIFTAGARLAEPAGQELLVSVRGHVAGSLERGDAWSADDKRTGHRPLEGRRLTLVVDDDEDLGCKCLASSTTVESVVNAPCSPNPPYIHVTTLEAKKAHCVRDGDNCRHGAEKCKVTVKAELRFPTSTCQITGGVAGPGIGTTNQPCQPAASPQIVSVSWTMEPPCRPGTDDAQLEGDGALQFWYGGCAAGNTIPTSPAPNLKFRPGATCAACK